LKTNLKTFPDLVWDNDSIISIQYEKWKKDFEAELRDYLEDYERHKKIGVEVQRWKYAIFIIKEVLGES